MIKIFYGPAVEFEKFLPNGIRPKTLTKLITELDAQNRKFDIVVPQDKKIKRKKPNIKFDCYNWRIF